ncbi:unnamed protein product [Gadus morhua 'NCC']
MRYHHLFRHLSLGPRDECGGWRVGGRDEKETMVLERKRGTAVGDALLTHYRRCLPGYVDSPDQTHHRWV